VKLRWVWLAALLGGCSTEDGGREHSHTTTTAVVSSSAVARPGRIPYLDFVANKGCHAYWRDPTTMITSIRREVRCPRELTDGDSVRLAGRVCFRESPDAARRGPIRCPYQLIKIQEALRDGEGEWDLSPQEED